MSKDTNKNLVTLLKIFKNRPYHLAKYLLENEAFNKDFLNRINNSEKLNEINSDSHEDHYFPNISQMEDFYNSLLEEVKDLSKIVDSVEIENNLNKKLDDLLKLEKYEEAAALRDYMFKNGIKRKN